MAKPAPRRLSAGSLQIGPAPRALPCAWMVHRIRTPATTVTLSCDPLCLDHYRGVLVVVRALECSDDHRTEWSHDLGPYPFSPTDAALRAPIHSAHTLWPKGSLCSSQPIRGRDDPDLRRPPQMCIESARLVRLSCDCFVPSSPDHRTFTPVGIRAACAFLRSPPRCDPPPGPRPSSLVPYPS